MKILWLSHFLPFPPKGGLLQRGFHLIKELSKHTQIDLFAFNQPKLLNPLIQDCSNPVVLVKEELSKYCRVLGVEHVPLSNLPIGATIIALKSLVSRYPYNVNWLISKPFSRALASILNTYRYDIIHFDTISLAYYHNLVKRSSPESKLSLGHHNIESHMLLRRSKNEKNLLKKAYYLQEGIRLAHYEKEYCPKFDLNITCSNLDSKRLLELTGAQKVCAIENGVDIKYFVPGTLPKNPKNLIFIGTMNWYPNIDAMRFFLSSIWPILIKKEPEISMDIIGVNPPEDILQYEKEDNRINIHGFVDDVRPYLASAGIYVCPIRDGGGTKLKILDAFASGIPVVAHPVACEGIDISDGKNVLLADNVKSYIDNIIELIHNDLLRHQLSLEARKLAESKYSFSSIGFRLYEELVSLILSPEN
ncbi:MAG: glycosyltransferase [Candidatus Competibacteraceae bacterium]